MRSVKVRLGAIALIVTRMAELERQLAGERNDPPFAAA